MQLYMKRQKRDFKFNLTFKSILKKLMKMRSEEKICSTKTMIIINNSENTYNISKYNNSSQYDISGYDTSNCYTSKHIYKSII